MRYLEQLLEVRDAVGPTLMVLGDGNWRMGDGVQPKPNQGKPAPGSESRLIEHYTCTHARRFTPTIVCSDPGYKKMTS
jgi:hypothetical protein